ncbi:hypothetical protein IL306_012844 [Fusarium sp. DS 682]|nr:hypothetical protein IL306_012844 [Fusarium sp. DS 682]
MIGTVLDSSKQEQVAGADEELREHLGEWHTRTNKLLRNILESERPSSSPNQLREMILGISTIKVEYLHALMALLKSHPPSKSLRLEAAREAISLLPSMVSNWTSVYNSMIWHLLYFPFIPYFVVFENLVHGHALLSAVTIQQDLDLLSTTASYYSSMRSQLQLLAPLSARLENIARVFLRLAQFHVERPDTLNTQGLPVQESVSQLSVRNLKANDSTNNGPANSAHQMQIDLGDEIGIDWEQYLQWLPPDTFHARDSLLDPSIPDQNTVESVGLELHGVKRPFDVMFDWFAWDVYYGDTKE